MNYVPPKYQIFFQDLGLVDYKEAWDYQEKRLKEIVEEREELKKTGYDDAIPQKQVFLFCEHPHVFTLGKSGNANNLLINSDFLKKIDATFYRINRGGDITYHGPGQIVGYPIIDLDSLRLKIKDYIWMLEEAVIRLLSVYNIRGIRIEGATGVWLGSPVTVKARKICSIGVRVSNRVTMHGFAFNVNTNLSYFNYINPCGFTDKEVTSLRKETGRELNINEIKTRLKFLLADIFNIEWKNGTLGTDEKELDHKRTS
jgi:lipoyl(octanoyl) transferase